MIAWNELIDFIVCVRVGGGVSPQQAHKGIQ